MSGYPPPKDGSGPPKDGPGGPPPLSYDHMQAGLKICREEGIDCDGAVRPADQCSNKPPKPPKMEGIPGLDDPVMYFNLGCYCCEEGEKQATTLAPQDEVVPALTRHAFGNGGVLTAKEYVCEKSNINCGEFLGTINQNCSARADSFKPLDDLLAEEDERRGNAACHCCQVHDSNNIFSNEEDPRGIGANCDFEKLDCPQILQEYDCTRRDFLGLEPLFGFGFGKNATVDADRLVCGCCFVEGSTLEELAVQFDKDSAATLSSTNPLAVLGSVMIFLKFILY